MTENLGRSERSRKGLVAVVVASEVSVSADILRAVSLDDGQEVVVDEVAVEMVLRER